MGQFRMDNPETGNILNDEQHGPHKNMGVNPGDHGEAVYSFA